MSSPMVAPKQVGFLGNHFEQALLKVAIARDALTEAADFVRTQAPAPHGVGINHAVDDPHVILRFGQFRARLHAAEGLLARATRLANATDRPAPAATAASLANPPGLPPPATAAASPPRSFPHAAPPTGATPTGPPSTSPPSTPVLVALLEAQAFVSDLITEITGQLIAWGGPPPPSRQQRDTPGQLGLHTATHWNYHHAGNYYLKGVAPPTPAPLTPDPHP